MSLLVNDRIKRRQIYQEHTEDILCDAHPNKRKNEWSNQQKGTMNKNSSQKRFLLSPDFSASRNYPYLGQRGSTEHILGRDNEQINFLTERYLKRHESEIPRQRNYTHPQHSCIPEEESHSECDERQFQESDEQPNEIYDSGSEDNDQDKHSFRYLKGKQTEAKRYNVFEDWRIIESIDHYILSKGKEGYLSKSLWSKLTDPRTGLRLLYGFRSAESMRERFKRWLIFMTNEDKKELRKFAAEHTRKEMRSHRCIFRMIHNRRTFITIKRYSDYDTKNTRDRITYAIPPKDIIPKINNPRKSERPARNQSHTKRMNQDDNDIRQNENPKEDSIKYLEEMSVSKRSQRAGFKLPRKNKNMVQIEQIEIDDEIEEDQQENQVAKEELASYESISIRRFSQPNLNGVDVSGKKEFPIFPEVSTNHESWTEMKSEDYSSLFQTVKQDEETSEMICESKKEEYEVNSAQDCAINEEDFSLPCKYEDLLVYVDYEKEKRNFVMSQNITQECHTDTAKLRLKILADNYGICLEQAIKLFNAVSGDYEDFEEYLMTGNDNILWTQEDDHGLILNDPRIMRYLRIIKGDERIRKRGLYLLGKDEKKEF